MTTYKLTSYGVLRLDDNTAIPADENNADYKSYLAWMSSGNVPELKDLDYYESWDFVRNKRNYLLKESDWTVLSDSPLSSNLVQEWKVYRQSLRDLPQTYIEVGVSGVIWPTPPIGE